MIANLDRSAGGPCAKFRDGKSDHAAAPTDGTPPARAVKIPERTLIPPPGDAEEIARRIGGLGESVRYAGETRGTASDVAVQHGVEHGR